MIEKQLEMIFETIETDEVGTEDFAEHTQGGTITGRSDSEDSSSINPDSFGTRFRGESD